MNENLNKPQQNHQSYTIDTNQELPVIRSVKRIKRKNRNIVVLNDEIDVPQKPTEIDKYTKIIIRHGENRIIHVQLNEQILKESVLSLKKQNFQSQLNEGKQVRFISMGRELKDEQIMSTIQWSNEQVILVMVSNMASQISPIQQIQQTIDPVEGISIEDANEEQLRNALQAHLQQIIATRQNLQAAVQDFEQNDQGTLLDLMLGILIGYVFMLVAMVGLCFGTCSLRAKQGIVIGFAFKIFYMYMIQSTQQTQTQTSTL